MLYIYVCVCAYVCCVCMCVSVPLPMEGSVSFGFARVRWGGRGRRQQRVWERHHLFQALSRGCANSVQTFKCWKQISVCASSFTSVWKNKAIFGCKGKLREFGVWSERGVRALGDRSVVGNKPLQACASSCRTHAGPEARLGVHKKCQAKHRRGRGAIGAEK